ncbi:S9 family peptidase [Methylibium sp. Root1272]|uniref:alpha/beta hydrolase family protein n=1 Tax=Methylibium sp. Root1272 TaxID=1736441 RepID=UPI0006FFA08A|nr:alpha/beta hydrolase [Methylibium sp. Root1272]KQW69893.1 dipeptidyl aminopeptidase [Methylibium sp. Root1272]
MTTAVSSATQALQRAMPITRLLDCGVDHADAVALFQRTTAGEDWHSAAESLASAQLERAAAAATAGHLTTATEAQSMAIANLLFAQMAFNDDDPRRVALYDQLVQAARQLSDWSDKRIERVELPFEHGRLIGWLVRPWSGRASGTVLLFGGQSGWGMAYLPIAKALARRGLATLLAEGPGQGETRMKHRIFLDVDVTAAYRQFITYIVADPSLGAPGIWGNSIGGLWAASTAAADDRVRACCVNGAQALPRLLAYRTFQEQAAAMLGVNDEAAVTANFERLSFRAGRDRITCPLLVLHGGADPLITLEDQQPFLDAAATTDKTLRFWPDGEHTIYNHAAERTAVVADWFVDRFAQIQHPRGCE